jgi:hypothetical protein
MNAENLELNRMSNLSQKLKFEHSSIKFSHNNNNNNNCQDFYPA